LYIFLIIICCLTHIFKYYFLPNLFEQQKQFSFKHAIVKDNCIALKCGMSFFGFCYFLCHTQNIALNINVATFLFVILSVDWKSTSMLWYELEKSIYIRYLVKTTIALRRQVGTSLYNLCMSSIPIRCQFHQHFTCAFFANILVPKNCKADCNNIKAAQFAFVWKTRA